MTRSILALVALALAALAAPSTSAQDLPLSTSSLPETLLRGTGTTELVADINTARGIPSPTSLLEWNGALYFAAADPEVGTELWRYDGTTALRVTDINPGAGNSSPQALAVYDGALYFSAYEPTDGRELWRYDGTAAARVADIYPGANGSSPSSLEVYDGALYFSATDGTSGQELWRHIPSGPAVATTLLPGKDGTKNDTGWRYLASPVFGGTRDGLKDDAVSLSRGHLLTWTGSAWEPIGSALPEPGRGFALYLRDKAAARIDAPGLVLDLEGTPATTDLTVRDLRAADLFHFLGNPFTEGFDLSALDLAGSGFRTTVHVFDPETQGYVPVTQAEDDSDVIAPWQGFLVERVASGGGTFSLTFETEGRVAASAKAGPLASRTVPGVLPLTLTTEADGTDRAALLLREGAEAGWDLLDATKPTALATGGAWLALASGVDGEPTLASLLARPLAPFEVGLHVAGSGAAELSWPNALGLPDGWTARLVDRQTGTETDLASTARYAFRLSDAPLASRAAVDDDDAPWFAPLLPTEAAASAPGGARFWLVVGPADVSASPLALALGVGPNPARGRATVSVTLPEASEMRVEVYDALGRRVATLTEGALGAGSHAVPLEAGALAPGVYLVRLEAGDQTLVRRLTVVR